MKCQTCNFNKICDHAFLLEEGMLCAGYKEGEAKADKGKLDISLVPPEVIWAIATIRKYGNEKYGDPNSWKTVDKKRYVKAFLRHTLLFWKDPYGYDAESELPHLWHIACNVAFLIYLTWPDMIEGLDEKWLDGLSDINIQMIEELMNKDRR